MARKGPEKRFEEKLPQVPITTEQKSLLVALASNRNMSLSGLVRDALESYVSAQPPNEIDAARQAAQN